MDDALRLIAAARESYKGVRDYTCVLVERERMGGALLPDSVIQMAVRTQPFSVYLRGRGRELAGQEACYVTGRNGGKMRAHLVGVLGVFGFISLDPDDPRAKATSRHSITEAGIGNLIERFAKRWDGERDPALTQVRVADYEYNKRPCTRVETVDPANPGGRFPVLAERGLLRQGDAPAGAGGDLRLAADGGRPRPAAGGRQLRQRPPQRRRRRRGLQPLSRPTRRNRARRVAKGYLNPYERGGLADFLPRPRGAKRHYRPTPPSRRAFMSAGGIQPSSRRYSGSTVSARALSGRCRAGAFARPAVSAEEGERSSIER